MLGVLRILKPRILCVDDQPSIVELLAALFGIGEEFAVETETDPLEVVGRARKWRPDVIVMDIQMPKRDGIEVARLLRHEPGMHFTPIVFYSGILELRETALRVATDGYGYFFQKGQPLSELEGLVRGLLSERLGVLHSCVPSWTNSRV